MNRQYNENEFEREIDIEDLLDFAEDVLQAPLHQWQREMLTCWAKGQIYISSRAAGKQRMANIYREWHETRHRDTKPRISYDVKYTYEQLMAGELA